MGIAAKNCHISGTFSPWLFTLSLSPHPPAVQYSEYVHPPFCQICAVCVWFIFCVFDVLHNVGKERSDSLSKNLTVCVTICPRIHRLLVNQMSLWISEVSEQRLQHCYAPRGEYNRLPCNLRDVCVFLNHSRDISSLLVGWFSAPHMSGLFSKAWFTGNCTWRIICSWG